MRDLNKKTEERLVVPIEPDKVIPPIVDYTEGNIHKYALSHTYYKLEISIAEYAVTQLVKKLTNTKIIHPIRWNDPPTTICMDIDYKVVAKMYENIMVISNEGLVKAFYDCQNEVYTVNLYAEDESKLRILQEKYIACLEDSNFFKGKCLKLCDKEFSFIPKPSREFKDVVLSDKLINEYKSTVVDFLSNVKMQEVCKKRRVILYGPPGSGKTSLISASFKHLTDLGITCITVTDVTGSRSSLEKFFSFMFKYLTPAFIVLEDIDLIGYDRNNGSNPFIGQLLNIFDGIEQIDKAAVFCSSTNRIESLDKAFTRPCRVDRKFKLDYMSDVEMDSLCKILLNVSLPERLKGMKKITGSHIQEIADTAKLLSKQNGGNPTKHIDHAVETVLEHFDIIQGNGTIGFSSGEMKDEAPSELQVSPGIAKISTYKNKFSI